MVCALSVFFNKITLYYSSVLLQFCISYHDDLTGTNYVSGTIRFMLPRVQMDVRINTHKYHNFTDLL